MKTFPLNYLRSAKNVLSNQELVSKARTIKEDVKNDLEEGIVAFFVLFVLFFLLRFWLSIFWNTTPLSHFQPYLPELICFLQFFKSRFIVHPHQKSLIEIADGT